MSVLKNMFKTLKQEGLSKRLDQYLILSYREEADRRSDVNSPSGALGCVRASYLHKTGADRKPPHPRLRRIFDNGHKVHSRLQKYFRKMGILLFEETPLFNKKYNIQGHTDGIVSLSKVKEDIAVLEIKSINDNGYKEIARKKEPKEDHKAQAQTYLFCLEEHRKDLHNRYGNKAAMDKDKVRRVAIYRKLYDHLKDDDWEGGYTREQKIVKKVTEHLDLDNVLIELKKPITKTIILYENKNTQEIQDFVVMYDEEILQEVLKRFVKSNVYFKLKVCPPRECKNRSTGCDYALSCWK